MKKMGWKVNLAKYRDHFQELAAMIAIAVGYYVLHILKIGCPIKFLTGISCAGCGMTRAWLSALKLDFAQAFYYHPLFLMVPIGVMVLWMRKRLPGKTAGIILSSMVVIFMVVYVMRMMDPQDTIVRIEFYESAVWRILRKVREMI